MAFGTRKENPTTEFLQMLTLYFIVEMIQLSCLSLKVDRTPGLLDFYHYVIIIFPVLF